MTGTSSDGASRVPTRPADPGPGLLSRISIKALRARRPCILGVFAPPDDETFATGGTLPKYAAGGADLVVLTATFGERSTLGAAGRTLAELARVRREELARACTILGIRRQLLLGLRDGSLACLWGWWVWTTGRSRTPSMCARLRGRETGPFAPTARKAVPCRCCCARACELSEASSTFARKEDSVPQSV